MNILSGSLSRLRFPKPLSSSNPRNLRRTRPAFTNHVPNRRLRTLVNPVSIIPKTKRTSLHIVGRLTSVRVSTMSNGTEEIRFPLSPSSALVIHKGDITKWFVDGSSDAIVSFPFSFFLFFLVSAFLIVKKHVVTTFWILKGNLSERLTKGLIFIWTPPMSKPGFEHKFDEELGKWQW